MTTTDQPPFVHAQLYAIQKAQAEQRPLLVVGRSRLELTVIDADDFTKHYGYIWYAAYPPRKEIECSNNYKPIPA